MLNEIISQNQVSGILTDAEKKYKLLFLYNESAQVDYFTQS